MSTLKSNVIEPSTGTDLTLGASGDVVTVPSDTLQLNTWKDSGGNTLWTSDGAGNLSSVNAGIGRGGGPNLILSQTVTGVTSVSFTTGIDSTYDSYMFVYVNINPSSGGHWAFQGSTDAGVSWGVTKTTTMFLAYHDEAGTAGSLSYNASHDENQSTAPQSLNVGTGAENDESCSGILRLWNPSSTTYVKHFTARTQSYQDNDYSTDGFVAGYFNTTDAITGMQFAFQHNVNAFDGTVKMYGCR